MCVSLHLVGGDRTIFAPYLLVPFLLAMNVLLLELGLVARCAGEGVVQLALAMPLGLLALATTGQPWLDDLGFCRQFIATLGGSPLWVTLLAVTVYCAAAGCTVAWLVAVGLKSYEALHGSLDGLDQLVWGLGFFLVALLISLGKTGLPQRWLKRLG